MIAFGHSFRSITARSRAKFREYLLPIMCRSPDGIVAKIIHPIGYGSGFARFAGVFFFMLPSCLLGVPTRAKPEEEDSGDVLGIAPSVNAGQGIGHALVAR